MTAIFMPASNQCDAGLIPHAMRSRRVVPGIAAYVTLRNRAFDFAAAHTAAVLIADQGVMAWADAARRSGRSVRPLALEHAC
jgi:hypothetical protein